MKATHSGRLRVSVRARWLEAVKMYGKRPIKLLNKINRNNPINRVVLPWKDSGPRRFLNSACKVFVVFTTTRLIFVGASQ